MLRGLASYLGTYAMGWVGNRVVADLRNAMFAKLLALPAAYYDDQPSGTLVSKLTFDVTQVTAAATSVLTLVFKDSLAIIGLLAYLLWLNWALTLLALMMAPLIVLVVRAISVRLRASSREVQQAMGYITQVLEEAIGGHRVVKLFGGQAYEKRRFDEEANRVRRHVMKQISAAAASAPVVQLIAAVALAVIIWIATLQSSVDAALRGRVRGIHHRDAAAHGAAEAHHGCERAPAEGTCGRRERLRAARSARGGGPGHHRDSPRSRRDPVRERDLESMAVRRAPRSMP